MEETATKQQFEVEKVVSDILNTIEREREREIIARRFGLYDRRETLEQIGELLGITRERVRQLEKAVITRLKAAASEDLLHIKAAEQALSGQLRDMGKVARVSDVTARLSPGNTK